MARRPSKPASDWNGRDAWKGASEDFDTLNAMADRLRFVGGPAAVDLADVLDAAAWALNRGELGALAKLAKLARVWLGRAQPLLSDVEKAKLGTLARQIRLPAKTELEAYKRAIADVEAALAGGAEARRLAVTIALAICPPLPLLRPPPRGASALARRRFTERAHRFVERLRRYAKARANEKRSPDAQTLVNMALRSAGIPEATLRKLVNSYGKTAV